MGLRYTCGSVAVGGEPQEFLPARVPELKQPRANISPRPPGLGFWPVSSVILSCQVHRESRTNWGHRPWPHCQLHDNSASLESVATSFFSGGVGCLGPLNYAALFLPVFRFNHTSHTCKGEMRQPAVGDPSWQEPWGLLRFRLLTHQRVGAQRRIPAQWGFSREVRICHRSVQVRH